MTLLTCLKQSRSVFCLFALYFNLIFVSFSVREVVNLSSISYLEEQWISNMIFGLQSLCLPNWVKGYLCKGRPEDSLCEITHGGNVQCTVSWYTPHGASFAILSFLSNLKVYGEKRFLF